MIKHTTKIALSHQILQLHGCASSTLYNNKFICNTTRRRCEMKNKQTSNSKAWRCKTTRARGGATVQARQCTPYVPTSNTVIELFNLSINGHCGDQPDE